MERRGLLAAGADICVVAYKWLEYLITGRNRLYPIEA